ncbi:MAG: phosphate acyltransferase PlsX [Sphingobacteriales bacterium]|nr:MAG: phosphate acyltransferase PlsX [Sphingobacteriales bacterium]
MNIGFDLMGGDLGPGEAIKGALSYFEQSAEGNLVLIGQESACVEHLTILEKFKDRYTFVHADEVITMHEHATKALKEKPGSSIAMGFGMLKMGNIDAFISAGNTGAMLVGSMYSVGAIQGVSRPTIATLVPRTDGDVGILLDVGANADCKPEHLAQFGQLGSLYAEYILGNKHPEVGLLNLGEEEGKGNILTQGAYPLLKVNSHINFIGNVEGRDLFNGKARVIVTDGFTGNVVLKMAESIYELFHHKIPNDPILEKLNYEMYGGVPVLGVNAPVIIGHGISTAKAFVAMIQSAGKVIKTGLIDAIKQQFATV